MKMPWSKPEPVEAPSTRRVVPAEPFDPTAPKGKPTPKRRDVQPRRSGPVAPPPKTGKEARARMREQSKVRKEDVKAGRVAPAEPVMTKRDAGPERAFIRNLVDSKRSVASFFPLFAVVLLVLYFTGMQQRNVQVYNVFTYIWLIVFVVIIVESLLLARRISKRVRERFPKSKERARSLIFYGVMRALMFRKGRYPKPVVKVGDPI